MPITIDELDRLIETDNSIIEAKFDTLIANTTSSPAPISCRRFLDGPRRGTGGGSGISNDTPYALAKSLTLTMRHIAGSEWLVRIEMKLGL